MSAPIDAEESKLILAAIADALKERSRTLAEMAEGSRFFFADPTEYEAKAAAKNLNADTDVVKRLEEIRQNMKLESMEALEEAVDHQVAVGARVELQRGLDAVVVGDDQTLGGNKRRAATAERDDGGDAVEVRPLRQITGEAEWLDDDTEENGQKLHNVLMILTTGEANAAVRRCQGRNG